MRRDGPVALPTEIVYGLGPSALDLLTVGRVFSAKGCSPNNLSIVHISRLQDVQTLVARVPENAWSRIGLTCGTKREVKPNDKAAMAI